MKRRIGIAAVAVACVALGACGRSITGPAATPRPEDRRGRLLNPIDRSNTTGQPNERMPGEAPGEREFPGGDDAGVGP